MRSPRTVALAQVLILVVATAGLVGGAASPAAAEPASVTIAGSLQCELGCPGDWQPECALTHLALDADDGVWQATFAVPAGTWEYKAALDGTWDENYGAGAVRDGPNIPLALAAASRQVLLRRRDALGDRRRDVGDRHGARQLPERARLRRPTGIRGACGRGCRTPTATASAGSPRPRCRPATTRRRSPSTRRGTRTTAPAACRTAPTSPSPSARRRRRHVQLRPDSHVLDITVDPDRAGGRRRARARAGAASVRRRGPVLRDPRPVQRRRPANNCGDYAGPCVAGRHAGERARRTATCPSDKGYYHGGDLEGLRRKLPYLDDLGISAIWVGPIYANKPVQPDTTNLYGHSSGYHGYWILDFLRVDPHLGTNARVRALVDEAHGRGIKVFMDIVTNHTADVIQLEGNAGYRNKRDFPYRDVNGQAFDDSRLRLLGPARLHVPRGRRDLVPVHADGAGRRGGRQEPGLAQRSAAVPQPRATPASWARTRSTATSSASTTCGPSAARWSRGWSTSTPSGSRSSASTGSASTRPSTSTWSSGRCSGRTSSPPPESAGIEDFFAFGEVFDQQFGPQFLSEFSTRGQLQSTIDFGFQLGGRGTSPRRERRRRTACEAFFADRRLLHRRRQQRVRAADVPRATTTWAASATSSNGSTSRARATPSSLARSQLAHALMFFARGQPVIYYGDEQGFTGDGGDKDAREDMFANAVPSTRTTT